MEPFLPFEINLLVLRHLVREGCSETIRCYASENSTVKEILSSNKGLENAGSGIEYIRQKLEGPSASVGLTDILSDYGRAKILTHNLVKKLFEWKLLSPYIVSPNDTLATQLYHVENLIESKWKDSQSHRNETEKLNQSSSSSPVVPAKAPCICVNAETQTETVEENIDDDNGDEIEDIEEDNDNTVNKEKDETEKILQTLSSPNVVEKIVSIANRKLTSKQTTDPVGPSMSRDLHIANGVDESSSDIDKVLLDILCGIGGDKLSVGILDGNSNPTATANNINDPSSNLNINNNNVSNYQPDGNNMDMSMNLNTVEASSSVGPNLITMFQDAQTIIQTTPISGTLVNVTDEDSLLNPKPMSIPSTSTGYSNYQQLQNKLPNSEPASIPVPSSTSATNTSSTSTTPTVSARDLLKPCYTEIKLPSTSTLLAANNNWQKLRRRNIVPKVPGNNNNNNNSTVNAVTNSNAKTSVATVANSVSNRRKSKLISPRKLPQTPTGSSSSQDPLKSNSKPTLVSTTIRPAVIIKTPVSKPQVTDNDSKSIVINNSISTSINNPGTSININVINRNNEDEDCCIVDVEAMDDDNNIIVNDMIEYPPYFPTPLKNNSNDDIMASSLHNSSLKNNSSFQHSGTSSSLNTPVSTVQKSQPEEVMKTATKTKTPAPTTETKASNDNVGVQDETPVASQSVQKMRENPSFINRKSYTSPRKNKHIRSLVFNTPPGSKSERFANEVLGFSRTPLKRTLSSLTCSKFDFSSSKKRLKLDNLSVSSAQKSSTAAAAAGVASTSSPIKTVNVKAIANLLTPIAEMSFTASPTIVNNSNNNCNILQEMAEIHQSSEQEVSNNANNNVDSSANKDVSSSINSTPSTTSENLSNRRVLRSKKVQIINKDESTENKGRKRQPRRKCKDKNDKNNSNASSSTPTSATVVEPSIRNLRNSKEKNISDVVAMVTETSRDILTKSKIINTTIRDSHSESKIPLNSTSTSSSNVINSSNNNNSSSSSSSHFNNSAQKTLQFSKEASPSKKSSSSPNKSSTSTSSSNSILNKSKSPLRRILPKPVPPDIILPAFPPPRPEVNVNSVVFPSKPSPAPIPSTTIISTSTPGKTRELSAPEYILSILSNSPNPKIFGERIAAQQSCSSVTTLLTSKQSKNLTTPAKFPLGYGGGSSSDLSNSLKSLPSTPRCVTSFGADSNSQSLDLERQNEGDQLMYYPHYSFLTSTPVKVGPPQTPGKDISVSALVSTEERSNIYRIPSIFDTPLKPKSQDAASATKRPFSSPFTSRVPSSSSLTSTFTTSSTTTTTTTTQITTSTSTNTTKTAITDKTALALSNGTPSPSSNMNVMATQPRKSTALSKLLLLAQKKSQEQDRARTESVNHLKILTSNPSIILTTTPTSVATLDLSCSSSFSSPSVSAVNSSREGSSSFNQTTVNKTTTIIKTPNNIPTKPMSSAASQNISSLFSLSSPEVSSKSNSSLLSSTTNTSSTLTPSLPLPHRTQVGVSLATPSPTTATSSSTTTTITTPKTRGGASSKERATPSQNSSNNSSFNSSRGSPMKESMHRSSRSSNNSYSNKRTPTIQIISPPKIDPRKRSRSRRTPPPPKDKKSSSTSSRSRTADKKVENKIASPRRQDKTRNRSSRSSSSTSSSRSKSQQHHEHHNKEKDRRERERERHDSDRGHHHDSTTNSRSTRYRKPANTSTAGNNSSSSTKPSSSSLGGSSSSKNSKLPFTPTTARQKSLTEREQMGVLGLLQLRPAATSDKPTPQLLSKVNIDNFLSSYVHTSGH